MVRCGAMADEVESDAGRPAPHDREVWDAHWRVLSGRSSWFGRLASIVRVLILARAVRHYVGRYFRSEGVFVEAGCGTGQASSAIVVGERKLLALDVSLEALHQARRGGAVHQAFVVADLRALPFRDGGLAGLWNLGVMEHFETQQGIAILAEMRRALSRGGVALLFWPPELGSSRWVLAPIEWLRSRLSGRPFRFFPDEVNRLSSRRHGRELVAAAGLEPIAVEATFRDALIHLVVVARRS